MITHIAGKFYGATNEDGDTFIGTKEKAEQFLEGTHTPQMRTVCEDYDDGAETTFGELHDDAE